MARRMVHTNLWQSEQFAILSDKAKILYIGTITFADDDGRLKANSLLLKGQVFPLDESVKSEDVRVFLNEIVKAKLVNYYKVEDQYYIQHPNWKRFQTLRADRKKDSNIPAFDELQPDDNQPSTRREHKISKDKISKDNNARKSVRKPKTQKVLDKTPMNLDQYVSWMKSSDQRHVQIVGEWAEAEGPNFTTKGQWESFTSRNVRIAKTLVDFSSDQIEKAYHLMLKDVEVTDPKTLKKQGFLTKYTLETLTKYIDRI